MPKRNKFSRSHYNLLTCNMGELIPIYWDEVIPGDIWQHRTSALIRLNAQVYPVMHPVKVRIHHWYVPYRLLWEDYEDFFTGGNDGTETPGFPRMAPTGTVTAGELLNYLGLPVGTPTAQIFNAMPVRAYTKIYNDHYRDQDLITELTMSVASGVDGTTNRTLQNVSWEKDIFTTARTTTQRGSDLSIPLTGNADVVPTGNEQPTFKFTGDAGPFAMRSTLSTTNLDWNSSPSVTAQAEWSDPKLEADMSSVSGVTLEDLRLAIGKQRYMEIMQRAGARYGEYARAIFGVNNPDARLQLPEYLGGGKQTIAFSEILATAEGTNTEVGDQKGHGIAAIRTRRYRRFVPEHGIIMSLMSVVPRAIYAHHIERQMNRNASTVKEDYFTPQLQGIGDDEILNNEVYALHSSPSGVFGYQNRYEEYRTKLSRVTAEMEESPNYNRHLARILSGTPALNQSFIECSPSKRIFADTSPDAMQCMISHSIQTRRPVGRTGMPSKI